jgi:hypothetical protein
MPERREVRIGSESDFLQLADEWDGATLRAEDGTLHGVEAVLRVGRLRAEARVWLSQGIDEPLAQFFADMAAGWPEWSRSDRPRKWSCYEGGLVLTCVHDELGHVAMTVDLREGSGIGWLATAEVPLEVGQLDGLVREVESFMHVSE